MTPTLLSFLVMSAQAHRPHTPMTSLALSTDFEDSGRAWATLDRYGFTPMVYSDDHGAHWRYYSGDPMAEFLIDAAYTDGGELVFASREGGVWISADEGASWQLDDRLTERGLAIVDIDVLDDTVLSATDGGLFGLALDGDVTSLWPEATRRVAVGVGEGAPLIAATDDGRVLVSVDGEDFEALPELPDGQHPWSVTASGDQVYAGSDRGLVYTLSLGEADWWACAPIDYDPESTYADRVTLLQALPDGRLAVATGTDSVFEADADCEAWRFTDSGLPVFYGGAGGALSTDEGMTEMQWRGERAIIAGYNGVTLTANDGATWRVGKMVPSDFDRGVAVAAGFPAERSIWQATYGGGVTWTSDGGLSWSGSAVGLDDFDLEGSAIYSFGMAASADPASPGTLYYSGAYTPYRSLDGGETWGVIADIPFNTNNFLTQEGLVYALQRSEGADEEKVIALRSRDGGETWGEVPGLADAGGAKGVLSIEETCLNGRAATLALVTSPPGLMVQYEGEGRWVRLLGFNDLGSHLGGGVWPPDEGTRLMFASTERGVLISDDVGETWREASEPPTDDINMMTQADDGTYFMASRTGWVFRSRDGGDTWERMANRTGPLALSMATSSRFEETGLVVLGTHAGVWWAWDWEGVWRPLPRYERFEDDSFHLRCTPARATRDAGGADCETYNAPRQGNGGGLELYHGDTLDFSFDGDAFSVVGWIRSGGELAVTVDGEWVETWAADDPLALSGLAPGWHDVQLYVAAEGEAGPLQVDRVETSGPGEPITDWPTLSDLAEDELAEDELAQSGCRCERADSESGALAGPVLLLLMGLRRRED